jgi:hypothetical protein
MRGMIMAAFSPRDRRFPKTPAAAEPTVSRVEPRRACAGDVPSGGVTPSCRRKPRTGGEPSCDGQRVLDQRFLAKDTARRPASPGSTMTRTPTTACSTACEESASGRTPCSPSHSRPYAGRASIAGAWQRSPKPRSSCSTTSTTRPCQHHTT